MSLKLLLILFFLISISCENELKTIFLIHRHGDRNPIQLYPTDPYLNETFWPDGLAELLPIGKERMFKVGKLIRKKYDGFLTDNIREVQIRTTCKDRCLESAQFVLNGIYKPSGRWIWNQNEKWQAFALHSIPCKNDHMLYYNSVCATADNEFKIILNSKYVKKLNQKFRNLYKYLSINTKLKVNELSQVNNIYNVLEVEKNLNFKLPSWVTDDLLTQLKNIKIIYFKVLSLTRKIQKLRSGVFLNELKNKILKTINQKKFNIKFKILKKLYIYSTHDNFISNLLTSLKIFNNLPPPLGSTLIFELYNNKKIYNISNIFESFSIKILYLNETYSQIFYPLKIPNCLNTTNCTIKQFFDLINDLIITDWFKECEKTNNKYELNLKSGNSNVF